MHASQGAAAIPVPCLHLKSNSHAGSGKHHLTAVLVNKVLDALEIPVPVHGADAELRHQLHLQKPT